MRSPCSPVLDVFHGDAGELALQGGAPAQSARRAASSVPRLSGIAASDDLKPARTAIGRRLGAAQAADPVAPGGWSPVVDLPSAFQSVPLAVQ